MCKKCSPDKKKAEKSRTETVVLSFGKGLRMKLFDIPDDYVPPDKRDEPKQEQPDQD